MRNLLVYVPESAQGAVAAMVHSSLEQRSSAEVLAQHGRIVEQLKPRFDRAAKLLDVDRQLGGASQLHRARIEGTPRRACGMVKPSTKLRELHRRRAPTAYVPVVDLIQGWMYRVRMFEFPPLPQPPLL